MGGRFEIESYLKPSRTNRSVAPSPNKQRSDRDERDLLVCVDEVHRKRRRELLEYAIVAAAAWPASARSQQGAIPVIGFLSGASRGQAPDIESFQQGLAESGYVLERDLRIEYRWAEGQFDRLSALAADLTSRRVALIATATLPAAMAAKAASPTTPVVFVIGEDPVKADLVASLSRPGGNATGVSDFVNQLVAKRLDILLQAVPGIRLVGLLVNPNNPNAGPDTEDAEAAANALGKKLLVLKATSDRELETAFETVARERLGCGSASNGDPSGISCYPFAPLFRNHPAVGSQSAPIGTPPWKQIFTLSLHFD